MRTVGPIVTLLVACSSSDPVIEAHRAGAGYAPENSETAVRGAVDAGYEGIEVDVAITADGVAILHHGRTLQASRCTSSLGEPVQEVALIDTPYSALSGVFCGGLRQAAFPGAVVRAERMLTLTDFVQLVRAADDRVVLHLDLQVEPADDLTLATEAVLGPWFAADLPHPFYVSSPDAEVLRAFRAYGAANQREVPTSLSWPVLRGDPVAAGVALELAMGTGTRSVVEAALQAEVEAVALQWEVARRSDVRALRGLGLDVQLWTLDTPRQLRTHQSWPVTSLITNYPGDVP